MSGARLSIGVFMDQAKATGGANRPPPTALKLSAKLGTCDRAINALFTRLDPSVFQWCSETYRNTVDGPMESAGPR
jgi:hypothetical protein